MRVFNQTRETLLLLLAATLCTTVIPFRSVADDKETGNAPAKPSLAKPDSPAPLTERERWMLDRMEQLEKRVAVWVVQQIRKRAFIAPPPTNVTASSFGIVQSVQTAENMGNRTGQLSLRLDF
jgi:hypothetical protein